MSRDTRESIFWVAMIIGVPIAILVAAAILAVYSCEQSWPDLPHRYELVAGCMVETPEDGWIPAANYRVLP